MFTGIVEEMGIVESIQSKKNLTLICIKTKKILPGVKLGDSIAVDGVCLTVVRKVLAFIYFEAMKETLDATTVGNWQKGTVVNLERALLSTSRLGGHFVTGHADGVGKITHVGKKENCVSFSLEIPRNLMKFIVLKGSICVNGVSLTVGKVMADSFEIYIIPYTLKESNLGLLKAKDKVNIEIDILARYVLDR